MAEGSVQGQKKKGLGPLAWILIGCGGLALLGIFVFVAAGWFVASKVKDVVEDAAENPLMTGAEWVVKLNPDYELVEKDEANQTLTILDKKKNETFIMNAKDVQDGKLEFIGEDGQKVTFDTDPDAAQLNITTNDGQEVTIGAQPGAAPAMTVTGTDGEQITYGGALDRDKIPAWACIADGEFSGMQGFQSAQGSSGGFTVTTGEAPGKLAKTCRGKLESEGLSVQVITMSGTDATTIIGNSEDMKKTTTVNIEKSDGGSTMTVYFQHGVIDRSN